MTLPPDVNTFLDRIAEGKHTETEMAALQQFLSAGEGLNTLNLGKYNVNIEQGQDIQIGDRVYVDWNDEAIQSLIEIVQKQLPGAVGTPENLPRSGAVQFVGRDRELELLHQQLQSNNQVLAIAGMGGIGKTELALQYALKYKQFYQGGVCWVSAKAVDMATQIVQFGRSRLQLDLPEELDLAAQVGFCWLHWHPGNVLVVLDDVIDYKAIQPYLPPSDPRFEVVITTRLRLGRSVMQLELDVLDQSAALELLENLVGAERIQAELDAAKQLCQWLGCLPLGIELVGRYLDRKSDLSLVAMQRRLNSKRLEERSLQNPDDDMTGRSGVATAFGLSWETLPQAAKQLARLLSVFAPAPIPWSLVEQCCPDQEPEDLEDLRDESLVNLHLLQRKDSGIYQLHQLIREFLQEKHACAEEADQLRQQFCGAIVTVAQNIPESLTRSLVLKLAAVMPHIAEAAVELSNHLSDEVLIKPFESLGRFYEAQGFYDQAETCYKQCLTKVEARFGSDHVHIAMSLSNLAWIYRQQGRYVEAEPLCLQALEMRQRLLGSEHLSIADSLNNLALIYSNQGRYAEAEPLCLQALEMRRRLLSSEHTDIADSLNNLALIYDDRGQSAEAETGFVQALEMRKRLFGSSHPLVAMSLNNLARCYYDQNRYAEAEPLYIQALALSKQLLGEEHPTIATRLNNLASLYVSQKRYVEAEPLLIRALEIYQKLLGEEHPDVAQSLNALAYIYDLENRPAEAEPLYLRAIAMARRLLGETHQDVAFILMNLADFYRIQGRYPEAEIRYQQTLEIFEPQFGKDHSYSQAVQKKIEKLHEAIATESPLA
jgi:tetratricopeptide (TPR) repeat protein